MRQETASSADQLGTNYIVVSPEMTALLGVWDAEAPVPPRPVALIAIVSTELCSLQIDPAPRLGTMRDHVERGHLVLLVQRDAMARLGGVALLENQSSFHLSSELRSIARALRNPPGAPEVHSTYRLAKAIEFVCEAIRQVRSGDLAPLSGEGQLSLSDTRRVLAARDMIDARSSEKLTLDMIARSCGLNRSKLTRGFKELFDCTVAQAIAERRLDLAQRMLLTTDLPVSSIGYESGYLNNASFARAFGRRYGRSPSDFRTTGLAA
jgi:AraC family transcriptional activator of pyochelin receptor